MDNNTFLARRKKHNSTDDIVGLLTVIIEPYWSKQNYFVLDGGNRNNQDSTFIKYTSLITSKAKSNSVLLLDKSKRAIKNVASKSITHIKSVAQYIPYKLKQNGISGFKDFVALLFYGIGYIIGWLVDLFETMRAGLISGYESAIGKDMNHEKHNIKNQ